MASKSLPEKLVPENDLPREQGFSASVGSIGNARDDEHPIIPGDAKLEEKCDRATCRKELKESKEENKSLSSRIKVLETEKKELKTEMEQASNTHMREAEEYTSMISDFEKKNEERQKESDNAFKRVADDLRKMEIKLGEKEEELQAALDVFKIVADNLREMETKLEQKQENMKEVINAFKRIADNRTEMETRLEQKEMEVQACNEALEMKTRTTQKVRVKAGVLEREKKLLIQDKENLVNIIRRQSFRNGEEGHVKSLDRQLGNFLSVAYSACVMIGYSSKMVMKAFRVYGERRECRPKAQDIVKILMEMEDETEPQGAVGGQSQI